MKNRFLLGDLISVGAFIYFSIRSMTEYNKGNFERAGLLAGVVVVMSVLKYFEIKRRNPSA